MNAEKFHAYQNDANKKSGGRINKFELIKANGIIIRFIASKENDVNRLITHGLGVSPTLCH